MASLDPAVRPFPNASDVPPTCSAQDESLRVPLAVVYSLLFLFGLAGNLLALWVFLTFHTRRNSVHVFLINVALADLVLLTCLPFRVLYHALGNVWPLGSNACRVVGNVFYMNMYVSITLLGLISLDRYLKIVDVGVGRTGCCRRLLKNRGWSLVACGALWCFSLVAVVPMIALAEGNEEPGKCFQYKQRRGARGKAYFNYVLVGVFWLVFAVLVMSYSRIALRLLRDSRQRPDLPNALRYGRTAKKSFVVLVLFTVCFAPYHAFRVVYVRSQLEDTSCERRRAMDRANEIMLLLSALNSCLDPVMYFTLSGSVRKAATGALLRLLCRDPAAANNSSTTEFHRTSVSVASAFPATPRGSQGLIQALQCKPGALVANAGGSPGDAGSPGKI